MKKEPKMKVKDETKPIIIELLRENARLAQSNAELVQSYIELARENVALVRANADLARKLDDLSAKVASDGEKTRDAVNAQARKIVKDLAAMDKIGRPSKPGKSAGKLTQRRVGELFGESEDVISDWECGRTTPPKTKDFSITYNKELRISGDIESLSKLAKDYKAGKDIDKYIDSKRKERLIEDGKDVNAVSVLEAISGMHRGDTPVGDGF